TYNNVEIYSLLENINNTLATTLKQDGPVNDVVASDSTSVAAADSTDQEENLLARLGANQSDSAESDSSDQMDATLMANNPLFAILSPSTYTGPDGQQQLAPGATIGYAQLKDTARVNSYLARPEVKSF